MKILVVDDKAIHQESARRTLADKGHDLTIATSFDEAMKLMDGCDDVKFEQMMEELNWGGSREQREQVREQCALSFPYEVVLSDMLMPMSKENLAPGVYKPGAEVPYGFVIALRAALRGAQYVAMATDLSHHHDAMSAALDFITFRRTSKYAPHRDVVPQFVINGAKCMFMSAPLCEDGGKNWDEILCKLVL